MVENREIRLIELEFWEKFQIHSKILDINDKENYVQKSFQVGSQFAGSILLKGPLLRRSENKPANAHQLFTQYINDDKLIPKVENETSDFEAFNQLFNLENFLLEKTSTNPPNRKTPTSYQKKNEENQE
ncbi:MAG: hypothetical protein EZS28_032435 [Streblomastix strix]|uniref:Uncharacterized protein n=1 Tax=Streblomastix strix TaxID=222440 RepID=A0A5J4UNN6_9EUKA|nr:MAG: hypothetical protein EZS28_032435 [Streblomastix strix]